jgi:hypothetical protein
LQNLQGIARACCSKVLCGGSSEQVIFKGHK